MAFLAITVGNPFKMHVFVGVRPGFEVVRPSALLLVEKAGDVNVEALGKEADDEGTPDADAQVPPVVSR